MISTTPHVKTNRIRALATTGAKRYPALPDLPTVAEAGVPGYENSSWSAIAGPAGMPKPLVARLHKEFVEILKLPDKLPDIQQKHTEVGAEIIASTPEQFRESGRDQGRGRRLIYAQPARQNCRTGSGGGCRFLHHAREHPVGHRPGLRSVFREVLAESCLQRPRCLRDVVSVRQHVEVYALGLSVDHGDSTWRRRLRDAHDQFTRVAARARDQRPIDEEWQVIHRRYHFALISACDSPTLIQFCRHIYHRFDRYRRLPLPVQSFMAGPARDRHQITGAALAGDSRQAQALLGRHIEDIFEVVMAISGNRASRS